MRILAALAVPLAFFAFASTSRATETKPRIEAPLVHENLAVFLLRGNSASGPVPLTLQEALAKGSVILHETGSVQELRIENKGSEPVFVQSGDLVKGGRQDRVLTVSLVIPPASGPVAIGAFCVEQGRWSKRGLEDATRFSASDQQIFSRKAKLALAERASKPEPAAPTTTGQTRTRHPSTEPAPANQITPRQGAGRIEQRIEPRTPSAGGQGAIWDSVAVAQRNLAMRLAAPVASESSRSSLQLTLENERVKAAQDAYLAALEPKALALDDVVGVVIAVNGRIASADVYPSNGLFRKMWPKLIRASATEAIAEKSATTLPPPPAVGDVERFLAAAEAGKASEHELDGIARQETRRSDSAIRVEARARDGTWVHRNFLSTK